MAALGHGLMMAPPGGPRQDVLDRRKRPPDDAPQQAAHLWHGERNQVVAGVWSRTWSRAEVRRWRVQRTACAWSCRCCRKAARLPVEPAGTGGNDAAGS